MAIKRVKDRRQGCLITAQARFAFWCLGGENVLQQNSKKVTKVLIEGLTSEFLCA
jgi:hypothetical protein